LHVNGMRSLVVIVAACGEGSQLTLEHGFRLHT